jgi:hypothetical protein
VGCLAGVDPEQVKSCLYVDKAQVLSRVLGEEPKPGAAATDQLT